MASKTTTTTAAAQAHEQVDAENVPKQSLNRNRPAPRGSLRSTHANTSSNKRHPSQPTKKTLRAFLRAVGKLNEPVPDNPEVHAWLEHVRVLSEDPLPEPRGWAFSLGAGLIAAAVAAIATWFATNGAILSTAYMTLGMGLGVLGVLKRQQEVTAIGGMLGKSLAWYLAPTFKELNQFGRYAVSLSLAAFVEYPFLTFANTMAMQSKTGLRLRAVQDAVDIVVSFIIIAVSNQGKLDGFAVSQMLLGLLRVVVATLGPRYCLPVNGGGVSSSAPPRAATIPTTTTMGGEDPALSSSQQQQQQHATTTSLNAYNKREMSVQERRILLERLLPLYKKVVALIERENEPSPGLGAVQEWMDAKSAELAQLPSPTCVDHVYHRTTKDMLVCAAMTVLGLVLGFVGFFATTSDPYIIGIAGVLGMGLAWYLGPSFEDLAFIRRWGLSVFLSGTLEYPFLSEANQRAALLQVTFDLRAIQDLAGLVASTMLITVLQHTYLNRVDVLQLSLGVLRVAVATRFFWSI